MPESQEAILTGTGIGDICKLTRHDDQLPAKRVSKGWLLSYLRDEDIAVISSLSVFLGSFDAAGAAAVASATGAIQVSESVRTVLNKHHKAGTSRHAALCQFLYGVAYLMSPYQVSSAEICAFIARIHHQAPRLHSIA